MSCDPYHIDNHVVSNIPRDYLNFEPSNDKLKLILDSAPGTARVCGYKFALHINNKTGYSVQAPFLHFLVLVNLSR